MGRPIAKSYFIGSSYPGAGDIGSTQKIAVSGYRTGGSTTSSTTAYIVNQRGSNRFKIHLEDSTEAVYTLKGYDSSGTALTAPSDLDENGTFCVRGILDDSTVVFITRFYKRTVHYVTAAGTTGRAPINNVITSGTGYQLNTTEATDETKLSGHVTIDSV
jgi:hypothetical protein